jgi:hypothetical protein
MNPVSNSCPLPNSAVWRFLSLYFHRNTALPNHRTTSSNPPFSPAPPIFPPAGPDNGIGNGFHPESSFLAIARNHDAWP